MGMTVCCIILLNDHTYGQIQFGCFDVFNIYLPSKYNSGRTICMLEN